MAQVNLPAGRPAGIFDIIAGNAPRGAIGDNKYVVNGKEIDNIFIYFDVFLTINKIVRTWKNAPRR